MTVIFEQSFERTLDQLVAAAKAGDAFEAWTFDDATSRRAAERRLADKGVAARIRSAYKPLVHAFLEDIDPAGVSAIEVRYPCHPAASENRFLLEAYPLAALVGDARIDFTARDDGELFYDVTLHRAGQAAETTRAPCPNRVHVDFTGAVSLSPTGWLRIAGQGEGARLETEYERLFSNAVEAVAAWNWGDREPYFEELNIRVTYPAEDAPLACGDEVISLREALHEDFYFSLLEIFLKKSGRPPGDRGLRPGQIVPEITAGAGSVAVRVETRALRKSSAGGENLTLDAAAEPLSAAQVADELEGLGGAPFTAQSRAGRTVHARYITGDDIPVMISAGQHANETTGVVGALRAARRLALRRSAHITVSPLENPDGYALHHRLRADNPRHMHHAARYTAFGDDLEYRNPETLGGELGEKAIRTQAQTLSGARLHINLHGYPSHEWTRPLSGYAPRGFETWTLPKGFFLILRYHVGWEAASEFLLDSVTRALCDTPGLRAFNERQIALYERHAGPLEFPVLNGFPCFVSASARHEAPVTLITEYPDETIYREAFVLGHTAQMTAALAAYDAWQELAVAPRSSANPQDIPQS